MSKTTHYELNTPIGSEVLSVMTGLNPNFTAIDGVMYDNETRSTQALNKANVNEQNIATALGRITTAEGDIDTLESGLETANTNISGLTSRMSTAEGNIVTANNRIQENTGDITQIKSDLTVSTETLGTNIFIARCGKIRTLYLASADNVNLTLASNDRPTHNVFCGGMIGQGGNYESGIISVETNGDVITHTSNYTRWTGPCWFTVSWIID
jgi:hypothetical protein